MSEYYELGKLIWALLWNFNQASVHAKCEGEFLNRALFWFQNEWILRWIMSDRAVVARCMDKRTITCQNCTQNTCTLSFPNFFFVRGYFDQLDFAGDILFFKLERRQSHQCQKQTLGGGRRSKTKAAISHASIRIIAFIVMCMYVWHTTSLTLRAALCMRKKDKKMICSRGGEEVCSLSEWKMKASQKTLSWPPKLGLHHLACKEKLFPNWLIESMRERDSISRASFKSFNAHFRVKNGGFYAAHLAPPFISVANAKVTFSPINAWYSK